MFILPIGNDDLRREGIPLMTLALAIVAITLHVTTFGRIARDELTASDATARAAETYFSSPWATLPDTLLPTLPAEFQRRYEKNRATTIAFDATAGKARALPTDAASEVVRQMEANVALAKASAAAGLDAASESEVLRALLRATPPALRGAGQRAVDAAAAALDEARAGSLIRAVGLTSENRVPIALLGHPWLHDGWFHLGLNVLFLIVAGSSLENVWRRSTLAMCLVMSASAAGLAHTAFSASAVPLIGLSGGVAGLMGAVLARLTKTPITILWGYWGGTLRWGTFELPAYLVLPFWFAGELFYALAAQDGAGSTGHTAHVAGFLFGFLFAVVFARTRLERRPRAPYSGSTSAAPVAPPRLGYGGLSVASGEHKDAHDSVPSARDQGRTGDRPLTMYEQERALKRERWGIAAPGGRGLAKAEPNPAALHLIETGTQLLGGAPSRPMPQPETDAYPDGLGIDPSQQADGGPSTSGAAILGSLPTRPPLYFNRGSRSDAGVSEGLSTADGTAKPHAPPHETGRLNSLQALPIRYLPAIALVFRRPDDGAPEAIPTDGTALLPSFASALRLDDSTIVSRYCDQVEQGALDALDLSPPEWLRLARALNDRSLVGHAVAMARRAHAADTHGPYAARSRLLEAQLLWESGDGPGALGCISSMASHHPNDPALEPARRLGEAIVGASLRGEGDS